MFPSHPAPVGSGFEGSKMTMTTTVFLVEDATQVRAEVAGFLARYTGATRRELRHRPAAVRHLVSGGQARSVQCPPIPP